MKKFSICGYFSSFWNYAANFVKLFSSALIFSFIISSCTTTSEVVPLNDALKDDEILEKPQKEVIILEEPETVYVENVKKDPTIKGTEAIKVHLQDITEEPEYNVIQKRMKAWSYRKEHVYQIHCQTYHTTIIQLEPGEELAENPYLSETDVWRWSRGTAMENGMPVQLIFIKPDYINLISTMTLVTDRRVYMLELKSFKDHYMPLVQWVYPRSEELRPSFYKYEQNKIVTGTAGNLAEYLGNNAQFISSDYKISYSKRKRPVWTPVFVCDDGQKTFIVLDKQCMNMTFPAVFKKNNEIVNSEVKQNVIILNELTEKITLRNGRQKVKIIKKKTRR